MIKKFKNKEPMIKWCCQKNNSKDELAIEFGVYSGYSISLIRKYYSGPVYGFDSFEGLPEFWRDGFDKGHFKTRTIPQINGVELVIGLFKDTLENFLQNKQPKIKLIHFDADLYSSTIHCLNEVTNYLSDDCIFIFDEFHNYPGWEDHEFKALSEWSEKSKEFKIEKIAEVVGDEQVVFSVKRSK